MTTEPRTTDDMLLQRATRDALALIVRARTKYLDVDSDDVARHLLQQAEMVLNDALTVHNRDSHD